MLLMYHISILLADVCHEDECVGINIIVMLVYCCAIKLIWYGKYERYTIENKLHYEIFFYKSGGHTCLWDLQSTAYY